MVLGWSKWYLSGPHDRESTWYCGGPHATHDTYVIQQVLRWSTLHLGGPLGWSTWVVQRTIFSSFIFPLKKQHPVAPDCFHAKRDSPNENITELFPPNNVAFSLTVYTHTHTHTHTSLLAIDSKGCSTFNNNSTLLVSQKEGWGRGRNFVHDHQF